MSNIASGAAGSVAVEKVRILAAINEQIAGHNARLDAIGSRLVGLVNRLIGLSDDGAAEVAGPSQCRGGEVGAFDSNLSVASEMIDVIERHIERLEEVA